MKKHKRPRLGLSLIFAAISCSLFMLTSLIVTGIGFIIMITGIGDHLKSVGPYAMMVSTLFASVMLGTVVSFISSRFLLKPIHDVIDAIGRLGEGDFSVRLKLRGPREFKSLSDSFNRTAEELGATEVLRADFINNFSHEFRTPIVSIKGFAEILKYGDLSDEERDEYLNIVISESNRLAELSTHILELSKLENQAIIPKDDSLCLSEQIRRCVLVLAPKWEHKKIDISVDLEDFVCTGNEEMLNQVWMNLLDNAIKFTPENGSITVSLKQERGRQVFRISDTGCGIDSESLKHIFDRFYQADTSRATVGTGLGLAIVKKIIEIHNGSIICKSAPGMGTEFVVELSA